MRILRGNPMLESFGRSLWNDAPLAIRRTIAIAVRTSAALALVHLAGASVAFAATDNLMDVQREVASRHDEAVHRLRDWIALPSIAAENLNYPAGAEQMAKLAREAGFQQV